MKRRWKHGLIVVGALLLASMAVVLAAAVLLGLPFSDPCRNEPVGDYASPDGTMKVVVFQRDCGATTGFSTQASIIRVSESLPDAGGNLFVAAADHGVAPAADWGGPALTVRWLDSRTLSLEYEERARVFRAETKVRGIDVQHTRRP